MILRSGLLSGTSLVLASVAGGGSFGKASGEACSELGASVEGLVVEPFGDEPSSSGADVLVWDGAAAFAAFDGVEGVRSALDGAWLAIRGAIDVDAGGQKIVLIAPPAGDAHAEAARAAVENMMRTLSVEWSRFGVRCLAVAIGQFDTETLRTKYPKAIVEGVAGTVPLGRLGTEEEMAWLMAYLASPAGDFFSGCVITLDGARDNWFGSWPPGGAAGEGGEPLAEERKNAG